jgi:hypothetical protein
MRENGRGGQGKAVTDNGQDLGLGSISQDGIQILALACGVYTIGLLPIADA